MLVYQRSSAKGSKVQRYTSPSMKDSNMGAAIAATAAAEFQSKLNNSGMFFFQFVKRISKNKSAMFEPVACSINSEQ